MRKEKTFELIIKFIKSGRKTTNEGQGNIDGSRKCCYFSNIILFKVRLGCSGDEGWALLQFCDHSGDARQ